MKNILISAAILAAIGCKENTTNTQNKTAETQTATQVVQSSTISTTDCSTVGELKEKFEQNGAVFERFSKSYDSKSQDWAYEWLKVTLPDGSCKIIDSIGNLNHYECTFVDWNGDGLKDRIDSDKWRNTVSLFSKTKNDFSDKIDGEFSGEQYDFDKSKGLKWQFLEDKRGGTYQLYKMDGLKLTALSEIRISNDDNERNTITILQSPTQATEKEVTEKSFLLPKKNGEEQVEESVVRYWNGIKSKIK